MKTILLALSFAALLSHARAGSPIIRVHAFSQEMIPGVAPAMTEEGKMVRHPNRHVYRMYIEVKPNVRIEVTGILLDGKTYPARGIEVTSPVSQFHPTVLRADTLIHRTKNKILRVSLRENDDTIGDGTSANPALRISYLCRGKKRSLVVKNFVALPAVAMP